MSEMDLNVLAGFIEKSRGIGVDTFDVLKARAALEHLRSEARKAVVEAQLTPGALRDSGLI